MAVISMLSADYVSNATYPHVASANVPKVSLRRIYLSSEDAISSANQRWQFRLTAPMKNVVMIDWAMISGIAGPALMSIEEIPNNGISSKGQGYFASLIGGTVQNVYAAAVPATLFQPVAFNQLTISLSGPYSQLSAWTIELYIYIQE